MSLKVGGQDYAVQMGIELKNRREKLDQLIAQAGVRALLFDDAANAIEQRFLGASGLTLYKPGEKPKLINDSHEFIRRGSASVVHHWAPRPDTVELVNGLSAHDIVAWTGRMGKLGIFYPDRMRADLADFLADALPGVKLVDVTDIFFPEILKKTPFEAELEKIAAARHDRVFRAIPAMLNESAVERDIVLAIRQTASRISDRACDSFFGALTDLYSGKNGEWDEDAPILYPGRSLSEGDLVEIKLQAGIAGGTYGILGRCFSLGEPDEAVRAACRVSAEAADAAAKLLIPGSTIAKAKAAALEVIAKAGYSTPQMCNIYAIGSGYCEAPMSDGAGEDLPLEENMTFAVGFPVSKGEKAFPVACWDAFTVRPDGGELLSAVERDILVV